jgi:DNA-binding beta-propeller fold protein YncE
MRNKASRHDSAALLAALLLALASLPAARAGEGAGGFEVLDRIAGPDGRWDYTTIDQKARRLYLGRKSGVLTMDLDTHAITPLAVPGEDVHGATPVGDSGLVLSTNGASNTVTIFESQGYKVRGKVGVGASPDDAVFDPATRLVAVMNHDDGTVSMVDPAALKLVRTIQVGGVLEAAAVAAGGTLYVNVADRHEIAVVDLPAGKLLRRYPLAGCEEPSGLAYDTADGLIASVCDNGVTKILHAADGTEVATIKTGLGSDGLIFDARRKLFFVPAGKTGTLSVIALDAAGKPELRQVVETAPGARLGALDEKTGRIYLPNARRGPPVPPDPWPSVVPGTFAFVVVGEH